MRTFAPDVGAFWTAPVLYSGVRLTVGDPVDSTGVACACSEFPGADATEG
jgi:hypothetical protein